MLSAALKSDLTSPMLIERVFQKHIVDGRNHFFSVIHQHPDSEYTLRHELASSMGISINDVVIIGSAKIGFSVRSTKFDEFDSLFKKTNQKRDKSDIDIAIVNRELFDKINRDIYAVSRHYDMTWIRKNWRVNKFNFRPSNLHQRYALYLAKGWIRPDYMPLIYANSTTWSDICDRWYKILNRRISLGFYSDWHFLKNYQMDNLERLRAEMEVVAKIRRDVESDMKVGQNDTQDEGVAELFAQLLSKKPKDDDVVLENATSLTEPTSQAPTQSRSEL